jgi:hypothetical protein
VCVGFRIMATWISPGSDINSLVLATLEHTHHPASERESNQTCVASGRYGEVMLARSE